MSTKVDNAIFMLGFGAFLAGYAAWCVRKGEIYTRLATLKRGLNPVMFPLAISMVFALAALAVLAGVETALRR